MYMVENKNGSNSASQKRWPLKFSPLSASCLIDFQVCQSVSLYFLSILTLQLILMLNSYLSSLLFHPHFRREYHRLSVFTCSESLLLLLLTSLLVLARKTTECFVPPTSFDICAAPWRMNWKMWVSSIFLMKRLHLLIKIWYRAMIKWLIRIPSTCKLQVPFYHQCNRPRLDIRKDQWHEWLPVANINQ